MADDELVERGHQVLDLSKALLNLVPVAGGVASGLLQATENVRQRRAQEMLTRVVEEHGITLDQLRHAIADERLAELIERGIRASADARGEAKLELLAAVVAAGIQPLVTSVEVERAHLFLRLIDELEPIHVRTLIAIGIPREAGYQAFGQVIGGVTDENLLEMIPDLVDIVEPVTGALVARGLIENTSAAAVGAIGPPTLWSPTPFGRALLAQLASTSDS